MNMNQDNVSTAFNMIQEELDGAVKKLNSEVARASDASSYEEVARLAQIGQELKQFRSKAFGLQEEWTRYFDKIMRARIQDEPKDTRLNEPTPQKRKRRRSPGSHKKGPRTNIRVIFPDGDTLYNETAAKTLAAAIEKIGIEKVYALNLPAGGCPLISIKKHERYSQIQKGKYYIMTNTPTQLKKDLLEEIAARLDVSIKVERIVA